MKAKDLIKVLSKCPDWDVIASIDDEGNGFRQIRSVDFATHADNGYNDIDLGILESDLELESTKKLGLNFTDVKDKHAVVLW